MGLDGSVTLAKNFVYMGSTAFNLQQPSSFLPPPPISLKTGITGFNLVYHDRQHGVTDMTTMKFINLSLNLIPFLPCELGKDIQSLCGCFFNCKMI